MSGITHNNLVKAVTSSRKVVYVTHSKKSEDLWPTWEMNFKDIDHTILENNLET